MTDTPKILGQVMPTNTNYATLYQAPAGVHTVISTLSMCNTINQNVGTICSANVLIVPSTQQFTSSNTNALYSGLQINASDTFQDTAGLTLGPGDLIFVKSYRGNDITFHVYGDEQS
jgi:hypothetical protein